MFKINRLEDKFQQVKIFHMYVQKKVQELVIDNLGSISCSPHCWCKKNKQYFKFPEN